MRPGTRLTQEDALRATLASIERFAQSQAITDKARGRSGRAWLDVLALIERGDPAPEWQFAIHTRYGIEHHHQADEHRAGPSCPCEPRVQWLGRSE